MFLNKPDYGKMRNKMFCEYHFMLISKHTLHVLQCHIFFYLLENKTGEKIKDLHWRINQTVRNHLATTHNILATVETHKHLSDQIATFWKSS